MRRTPLLVERVDLQNCFYQNENNFETASKIRKKSRKIMEKSAHLAGTVLEDRRGYKDAPRGPQLQLVHDEACVQGPTSF